MSFFSAQFRALGKDDLPDTVRAEGRVFGLERTFKHAFATAVGLYACGGERIVCKFHRRAPFFGLPLRGVGEMMAAYEAAALRKAQGLKGVPDLRRSPGRTEVAHDFVPGQPLRRDTRVDGEFFPALLELLSGLHSRGMAYVDLEKPENILAGDDGRPYLIDFQTAFYVPKKFLGETALMRALRGWLQRGDLYHAMKHFRRVRGDLMTAEQVAASRRRPWPVRVGNILMVPLKTMRKLVSLRE